MQERNSQKVLLTALLECCLARQRLEWLLERREAAGRGKRGGGSFEIEMLSGINLKIRITLVARGVVAHLRLK